MPLVKILPPSSDRISSTINPLPTFLQTPSGLALVELQATIHAPITSALEDSDTPMDGSIPQTVVGNLVFPLYDASKPDDTAWMKRVYFYVGKHQRITGEVKKIPKPIALLRRAATGDDTLEIVELLRYKIVFSQRPEPVGEI